MPESSPSRVRGPVQHRRYVKRLAWSAEFGAYRKRIENFNAKPLRLRSRLLGERLSDRQNAAMTAEANRPKTARDMRVLLIGAPGAGKGTQAVRIAEHFGLTHISSGDLLRQHIADGTAIGRQAADYVKLGDLVPDGIVMDMLYKPVRAATERGGYVLDG